MGVIRIVIVAFALGLFAASGLAEVSPLYERWSQRSFESTGEKRIPGPFRSDGIAFFLVHRGGDLRIDWTAEAESHLTRESFGRVYDNAFLLRLFAPDGRELEMKAHRFKETKQLEREGYIEYEDLEPGIYELYYVASQGNTIDLDIEVDPAASFGILPLRNHLVARTEGQFDEVYFYVPPRAHTNEQPSYELMTHGTRATVFDDEGNRVLSVAAGEQKSVELAEDEVVWRLETGLSPGRYGFIGQGGSFDAILCPDAETARAIMGGMHVSPDGWIFWHAFQVEMWNWIRDLREEDLVVSARIDPESDFEKWAGNPRNRYLWGPWGVFSHLPYLFEQQTLERPVMNRDTAVAFAVAYTLDEPFNPFYRDEALRNRLLLAEFAYNLRLRKNETLFPGWGQFVSRDTFSGSRYAFALASSEFDADDAIFQLWYSGARRAVERFAFHRTSAENQSTHVPLNLQHLYVGSGRAIYRDLAAAYVDALFDESQSPSIRTGYLMEGYGPDATYQGISVTTLGWYYRMSGNETAKEGLRRIFNLFNHTAAPEFSGRVMGASHFSHRTPGSWVSRQHRGGSLALAQDLPEAAVWHRQDELSGEALLESADEQIFDDMQRFWGGAVAEPGGRSPSAYRHAVRYEFYPDRILDAELPVVAENRFVRQFGDEFIAIRKPHYYLLFYVGSPDPVRDRVESDDPDRILRRTGGGISMLWSPHVGNVILSTNEHAEENQMILAQLDDGLFIWPDYWSVEAELDPAGNWLRVSADLKHDAGTIQRHYRFKETQIEVEVELHLNESLSFQRLQETLPVVNSDYEIESKSIDLLALEGHADRLELRDGVKLKFLERNPSSNHIYLKYMIEFSEVIETEWVLVRQRPSRGIKGWRAPVERLKQ